MDKLKEKKEKTPAIDSFPTDETPTPTKILRMADMDLFQDLKENPFDPFFRKATEAVKAGQESLSASLSASELPGEESLNTPQIYCSEAGPGESSPSLTSRPVILRSHSDNRVVQQTSNIPVASVQPVKAFKAIAPSPSSLPFSPTSDNALLLLRLPGGETVKLSNLPFVKCDSTQPPSAGGGGGAGITVNHETKLKLKKTLKTSRSTTAAPASVSASTPVSATAGPVETSSGSSVIPPGGEPAVEDRDDLKERNRMSAQRSRLKKRQQLEQMQGEKCLLSAENKALRAEVRQLRQILSSHLDCSVTVRAGTRETLTRLSSQVGPGAGAGAGARDQTETETKSVKKQNIETQTAAHCEQYQHQSRQSQSAFRYESATSPPQTYPEDLRVRVDTSLDTKVDTRMDSKVDSKVDTRMDTRMDSKVDTRMERKQQQDEKVAVTPVTAGAPGPGPGTEGRSSRIKQRLALHCAKVGQKKKLKASNKARLKDKLQIIKQKMAEDENLWSSIQSTKNK